jgi:hypothetical protein
MRLGGQQLWDKRDSGNVLFVSNDTLFAREFGNFAKAKGMNVNYAWSLEGLDFLPLSRVNLAVIAGDRWYDHEIFGRPVSQTLQSFPKIIVELSPDDRIPGGKHIQENVEYVQSREDLYTAVSAYISKSKKESDSHPDFPHQ